MLSITIRQVEVPVPVAVKAVLILALASVPGCGGAATAPAAAVTVDTIAATDGVAIAYDDRGSGAPALVFVHGWCCDRTHWDAQVEPFSRNHRVVRIDLAGHGESGADRAEWTLAGLADDVRTVVETLRLDDVVLVGHSLGGYVVLEAAASLRGRVRGVVGVDTLHDVEFEYVPADWKPQIDALRADFARGCDGFVRGMFRPDAEPALVERVVAGMCDADPAVALPLLQGLLELDFPAVFGGFDGPLRVLFSGMDPINVEANRLHAPGFEAVVLDGVGHFPMLERPAEFNRALAEAIDGITGLDR